MDLIPCEIELRPVIQLIFLPLILDVSLDHLFVDPHRSHEVSSAPKAFLYKKHFPFAKFMMYSYGTFAFQKAHRVGYAIFRRDGEYHVNVIRQCVASHNLYPFLFCKLSEYPSDSFSYRSVEHMLPVFRHDDDMVCAVPHNVLIIIECIHIFWGYIIKNQGLSSSQSNAGTVEPHEVPQQSWGFMNL